MFKVAQERRFTRTVPIFVPTDEGHEKQSIKATYRVIADGAMSQLGGTEGQKADLRAMIVSLDDMIDDDGNAVAYTPELLEQFADLPFIRVPLLQVYVEAVTKVKAGN